MNGTYLDDQTTNQILNAVAKEYAIKPHEIELNDHELDELLDEIEEKSDEDPQTLSSSNSENENLTLSFNPHHELLKRCNDILNDKHRLNEILLALFSWCGQKGLTYMDQNIGKYGHMPSSLFPHLVSLEEWLDLRKCSLIFHKLIDRMSRDSEFLLSRMKCIADADPYYTGKLYQIYKKKVEQKQFHSKYVFCSLRMDYMRNGNRKQIWSQIESQFTPGGPIWIAKSNHLHHFLLERYVMERKVPVYDTRSDAHNLDIDDIFVPPHDTIDRFVYGVATAAKLVHSIDPVVLIIKDSSEMDCHELAQELWERYHIKSIFRTYAEVGKNGYICEDTKDLMIDSKWRISFVYCRGGSKRKEWNDKNGMDWKGRELIDFCTAVVDADIAYTLINTKFMQTIYSDKKVLLSYLDKDEAQFLYKHFVANYNFDPKYKSKEEINGILDDVKLNYDNYVMKPSGDGGGHCIFGKDIPELIEKVSAVDNKEKIQLEGWILMEKIRNCIAKSIHVRDNKMQNLESVHEIGIYSQYLADSATGKLVIINECIGDLIKTRNADFNEAGISAGYGVIDTIVLDASK